MTDFASGKKFYADVLLRRKWRKSWEFYGSNTGGPLMIQTKFCRLFALPASRQSINHLNMVMMYETFFLLLHHPFCSQYESLPMTSLMLLAEIKQVEMPFQLKDRTATFEKHDPHFFFCGVAKDLGSQWAAITYSNLAVFQCFVRAHHLAPLMHQHQALCTKRYVGFRS